MSSVKVTSWEYAYQCPECGNLQDNYSYNRLREPCPECGTNKNPVKKTIRHIKRNFFGNWEVEILEDEVTYFHKKLAKLLEIEADGGDDPAAFVKDCIERVRKNK